MSYSKLSESFGERVIHFNQSLHFDGKLPEGIQIMNPFQENPQALEVSSAFYQKFYHDNENRTLIIGINPGRHGAGVTGIPFTDTKNLSRYCQLELKGMKTYELSAEFIYEVINTYGGVEKFYKAFYINSICPLGFVVRDKEGKEKNYNYYDSKELEQIMQEFMIASMWKQISLGLNRERSYCLGTGKHFQYLKRVNEQQNFFKEIIPLEHPRYIMQYKRKERAEYLKKYMRLLRLPG